MQLGRAGTLGLMAPHPILTDQVLLAIMLFLNLSLMAIAGLWV